MRLYKPSGSELLLSGWLPPHALADKLGISIRQLMIRVKQHKIRRRELAPGTGVFVYAVGE